MNDTREYTVREIASILSTSEETVRRWIRDGKLAARSESKKQGHRITTDNFQKFLLSQPKYCAIATGLLIPVGGLSLLLVESGIRQLMKNAASQQADQELSTIDIQQLTAHLEGQIAEANSAIARQQDEKQRIEKQILELETHRGELEAKLAMLKGVLQTLQP